MNKQKLLKLVGQKIKEKRQENNVTQQELAAACNFEKSNLSRIEAGKSNVTIHTLNKIATALEIPIKTLVDF